MAFNLKRNFGIVADFGGYDDTQLQLAGPGANPPGVANSSGTVFTYLAGPRLSYRHYSRITPFAQILFGAVHASEVSISGCTGSSCTPPLPAQTAFAMTAGGEHRYKRVSTFLHPRHSSGIHDEPFRESHDGSEWHAK